MQKQLNLPLIHFPYQEYLGNFKRVRRALAKANEACRWMQLELKLYLRKLVKGGIAFTIKAPSGREFRVPTIGEMAKRFTKVAIRFFSLATSYDE